VAYTFGTTGLTRERSMENVAFLSKNKGFMALKVRLRE
jgi:hypothetical protein